MKQQKFLDNPDLLEQTESFVELTCDNCGKIFTRRRSRIKFKIGRKATKTIKTFCSQECRGVNNKIIKPCANCGKLVSRQLHEFKENKSGNIFCSKSCAATYNNLHKTTGTRRSKLEIWLEEQLRNQYPNLEILFNGKEAINAELDIHFPKLNLAFELNGIYHYEPIHGQEKLSSIQNNDGRKFQACLEKGIELCIIDSSKMVVFTMKGAEQYLKIILDIINLKISSI